MAATETASRPQDRHARRRPFTNWMKRLANLKSSSYNSSPEGSVNRSHQLPYAKVKKSNVFKNNPYPLSGKPLVDSAGGPGTNGRMSFNTPPSGRSASYVSPSQSKSSIPMSSDSHVPPTIDSRSMAPTISTYPETVHSDAARSKAGTTATTGGAMSSAGNGGGEGSTFSSPAPSERSITTTLTTMQSAAPSTLLMGANVHGSAPSTAAHGHHNSTASQFTHQFPTSSPASAIPPYLSPQAGGGHPATYNTATANNLLTDNASVMTLASSSKRRRRNSLDTNASVRALAPSSIYGGSKESLPLSILSANINEQASLSNGHHIKQSQHGAGAERASVYSSSGIAPVLPSGRNSYYASKQSNATGDDGRSVRSVIGHGRTESLTKSLVGGSTDSPLQSPKDHTPGKLSRKNSGNSRWSELKSEADDDDYGSIKKRLTE